jgi:endoglucanase
MNIVKTLQISNEWVIVIISTLEDVVNEIDRLSGGIFKPDIQKWLTSKNTATWDYNARNRFYKVRDQYIAQARINVGEQTLDDTSSYSPTPLQVGRNLVGIDENITTGGPLTEYVHYCYLKVPTGTTSITVGGKTVSINLNDNQVSRSIKVNQVGYLPDAPKKYAYLGAHVYGVGPLTFTATTFQIVNSDTNQVAYTGNIVLRDSNKLLANGRMLTGENVYEMNFSDFTETGNYFIRIAGVGKSWTFKQSSDVYGEVFYTHMKGMYHQRCGIALKAPYTNWPRPACHTKPVCESKFVSFPSQFTNRPNPYERFDIIGQSIDTSSFNVTASGGWHDAADWDRNTQHYTNVFDMLYAYELNPTKFKANQLNIPESNDALPDILNEVEYGLQVWKRSMNSIGGISGMIEMNTHPTRDIDGRYTYSVRTRWDSLLFSAAAAMVAQMIKPFDPAKSKTWEWYAVKSYNFGSNPKNSLGTITIPARRNRGTGEYYEYTFTETEAHIEPLLAHAKSRLYKLTNNATYLTGIDDLIGKLRSPFKWPYTNRDYSQWINYSILDHISDTTLKNTYIKRWFTDYADTLLPHITTMPYRCTWPVNKDFWLDWGAGNMVNENRSLLLAYKFTNNIKYKEAALLNLDYMMGANPMGMTWTSGLGQVYPVVFQHETSQTDGIVDPVPGITLYGITGGSYSELRLAVWKSPSPTGPVEFKTPTLPFWRTWTAHPLLNTRQCEFTIQEVMSCHIFSSAMLLPDNWLPSTELKNKAPKTLENLHGYYYLP